MFEGAATAVYLLMAGTYMGIGCWKGYAFLREPTLTLALMSFAFFAGGLVYAAASPAGYRFIGDVFNESWFATLPVYLGILTCFAICHLLTLLWAPRHLNSYRTTRNRMVVWITLYGATIVAMVVLFVGAHPSGPADPLRFNTEEAGEPRVLVFLGVFLCMLACATLSTWRQSRRTRLADEQLQHALRWFGGSMVVTAGYVVCSAPAIAAAATGHHGLDTLGVLGSVFGIAGCIGTGYGMSGAAVSAWLRERRDIAVLQPLWDLVVAGVDEELAFSSNQARPNRSINVRWTLHRRVIEILDGIRQLRTWVSDEPSRALAGLHHASSANESDRAGHGLGRTGGLSPQELEAATTAAVLRHAVQRLQAARAQHAHASDPPPPGVDGPSIDTPGSKTAAAEERARLVRVARALNHPLVENALRLVDANHRVERAS